MRRRPPGSPPGSHRIDASFFGDPSTGENGPQRASALLVTDTSSFSSLKYGGHNQTLRYSGAFSNGWLLEGTVARAQNQLAETPSVQAWRVTDQTVSPTLVTRRHRVLRGRQRSVNRQFAAKATNSSSSHELRFGIEYDDVDYSQINQRTGPTFTAPDGRQTATGAEITVLPDANFGQIYRVTRANFNTGRATTQGYTSFFVQDTWRAGNRLTINPGLRYEQEKPVRHARAGLHAEEQLGAADRRHLPADGRRQDEAVRQLRHLLRARAERPGGAVAVGRRLDQPRRLLRRRPHTADSQRRRDDRSGNGGRDHQPLRAARASAPDTIDPNAKLSLHLRVSDRRRARDCAQDHRRRPLHQPAHRTHPRGCRQCAARRLRPAAAGTVERRVHPDQSEQQHAGAA